MTAKARQSHSPTCLRAGLILATKPPHESLGTVDVGRLCVRGHRAILGKASENLAILLECLIDLLERLATDAGSAHGGIIRSKCQ